MTCRNNKLVHCEVPVTSMALNENNEFWMISKTITIYEA